MNAVYYMKPALLKTNTVSLCPCLTQPSANITVTGSEVRGAWWRNTPDDKAAVKPTVLYVAIRSGNSCQWSFLNAKSHLTHTQILVKWTFALCTDVVLNLWVFELTLSTSGGFECAEVRIKMEALRMFQTPVIIVNERRFPLFAGDLIKQDSVHNGGSTGSPLFDYSEDWPELPPKFVHVIDLPYRHDKTVKTKSSAWSRIPYFQARKLVAYSATEKTF